MLKNFVFSEKMPIFAVQKKTLKLTIMENEIKPLVLFIGAALEKKNKSRDVIWTLGNN